MFNPLIFKSMTGKYYDCSVEEINQAYAIPDSNANTILGIVFLICGIIYVICYIPCIIVIFKHRDSSSSFKLMLLLGIIDVTGTFVNGIMTGIILIKQLSYCESPKLFLSLGCLSSSLWCGSSLCAFFLSFNRVAAISKHSSLKAIFIGKRTYYIWVVIISYILFFLLFTSPFVFSVTKKAWLNHPFQDYPQTEMTHENSVYTSYLQTGNNVGVIFGICITYGIFLHLLIAKAKLKKMPPVKHMPIKTQKTNSKLNAYNHIHQIQVQIIIISVCIFASASAYLILQFFEVPNIVSILSQVLWLSSQGLVGVVYLVLNTTIRKGVFDMLGINKIIERGNIVGNSSKPYIIPLKPIPKNGIFKLKITNE